MTETSWPLRCEPRPSCATSALMWTSMPFRIGSRGPLPPFGCSGKAIPDAAPARAEVCTSFPGRDEDLVVTTDSATSSSGTCDRSASRRRFAAADVELTGRRGGLAGLPTWVRPSLFARTPMRVWDGWSNAASSSATASSSVLLLVMREETAADTFFVPPRRERRLLAHSSSSPAPEHRTWPSDSNLWADVQPAPAQSSTLSPLIRAMCRRLAVTSTADSARA